MAALTMLRNGIIAGLVATTTMNASYWAERRIRRNVEGPLDYDDSNVPALVAAKMLRPVVRNTELSDDASRWLGFAVHWGYGSLFGLGASPHPPVRAGGRHRRVLVRNDGHGLRHVPGAGRHSPAVALAQRRHRDQRVPASWSTRPPPPPF